MTQTLGHGVVVVFFVVVVVVVVVLHVSVGPRENPVLLGPLLWDIKCVTSQIEI